MPVAAMPDPLRFQHYEVVCNPDGGPVVLGRGAMGVTYRAFDTNLRADVALKVISGAYLNSDTSRERFLREARAAAAIRHPNVATVFHLGEAEESYFYAMEFVEGETVEHLMRRIGPLPTLRALDITSQVARALGAAQKQNLVHRDIKPSNIMLTHDDDEDEDIVKVIDFGLAKAAATETSDGDAPTLTMGGFLGTPHFASPEQLDERELDVRSDIYSLGVTLFYLLAGEVPFGGSLAQTISRQLQHQPPWEKIAAQPREVRDLIERMMAKSPDDRFASPLELRRAIDSAIATVSQDPQAATTDPTDPPIPRAPQPWSRRSLLIAGCATLVLLCLLLLFLPRSEPKYSPTNAAPAPAPTAPPVDRVTQAIEESGDRAAVDDLPTAFATLAALGEADARDPRVSQTYEHLAARLRAEPTDLARFEAPLQTAVAARSLSATYLLASLYDQQGRAAQAFPLYLAAAKAGDAEAMTKTGAATAAGWGTAQSWPESIDWFTRAAAAGDPSADYALGECYALGKGVPRDPAKAFIHLDRAARDHDHILAKTLLADLYLNGAFGPPNNTEAFRLFTQAAEQGSLVARAKLGVMIYSGKIVDGQPLEGKPQPSKEGYREAFQIFAQGAAQDHPLSLYYHALLLDTGTGTDEKDPTTARAEFIRAARAGEKNAIAWCRQNDVAYQISDLTLPPEPTAQPLPATPEADATEAQ
jgi:serine/threonine protein kinase